MNGNRLNIEPSIVISTVSDYLGISTGEIFSPRRFRYSVKAKHIAMSLIKKYSNRSLAEIGKIFGRDHATVIYATHSVEDQARFYVDYRFDLGEIERLLHKKCGYDSEYEAYKNYNTENT